MDHLHRSPLWHPVGNLQMHCGTNQHAKKRAFFINAYIKTYGVVIMINEAWKRSFGRVDYNKKVYNKHRMLITEQKLSRPP
jgi:hypothetical protein